MTEFVLLLLATFWVTHLHVYLIRKFNVKLPVKQWETCYHCSGFWYAIILYFLAPQQLLLMLAACTVVYVMNLLMEKIEYAA